MRRAACTALGILLLTLLRTTSAAAQTPDQPPPLTEQQVETYAKTYVAVSAARDAVHLELAQARNKTPEAQKQLQERLREEIAGILKENGFTEEEYRRRTYLVSSDPALRKRFDDIVAELTKKTDTGDVPTHVPHP